MIIIYTLHALHINNTVNIHDLLLHKKINSLINLFSYCIIYTHHALERLLVLLSPLLIIFSIGLSLVSLSRLSRLNEPIDLFWIFSF